MDAEELEAAGVRLGETGFAALSCRCASVTVRRSCARGTGSPPGATASRSAARSRAISSSRASSAVGALGAGGLGRRAGLVLEPVERVLDALEPLGDRAQPARQALDVGGGRDVERAHRRLLRLDRLLARLESAGDRAVDHRVGDQLLGDLARGPPRPGGRGGPRRCGRAPRSSRGHLSAPKEVLSGAATHRAGAARAGEYEVELHRRDRHLAGRGLTACGEKPAR